MNYRNNNLGKRIVLDGTINTRDLGGYKSNDGRTIKFKRIIRTDNLSRISEKDISFLLENYNPKYDLDLRSENECRGKEDKKIPGCQLFYLPVSENLDLLGKEHPHEEFITVSKDLDGLIHFIYRLSEDGDVTNAMEDSYKTFISSQSGIKNYHKFFQILIDNKEGCVLFHCADGKDRAGIAAALFLTLMGVDEQTVKEEYLLTNENTWDKANSRYNYLKNECNITNEKLLNSVKMLAGVRINWLNSALQFIKITYGGVEGYFLNALGFTKEDLNNLKDNYLE